MKLYEQFYRAYGIRRINQIMTPPLPTTEVLELPRNSVLHYVSVSKLDIAPSSDDPLFMKITKPILMDHVVKTGGILGNPHVVNTGIINEIKEYHQNGRNRRFRKMQSLESAERDETTLIVYNYGFLNNVYKYQRSLYTEYYRWHNDQAALWNHVAMIADTTTRQQFVRYSLPELLPTLSDLRIGEVGISQKTVQLFANPEAMGILELWKWFGPDRQDSILSSLSDKQLETVNLLFIESGRWFVVNLGLINSWRGATGKELLANPEANVKGLDPHQLQIRFMRLMMSLFEVRTVAETTEVVTGAVLDSTGKTPVVEKVVMIPTMNRESGKVVMKPQEGGSGIIITNVSDEPNDTGADLKSDAAQDKAMIEDLEKLEFISRQAQEVAERQRNESPPLVVEAVTPVDGMKVICDRLAASGAISGAEYKRYTELSHSYKSIVSPDGKSTLEEFVKIAPGVGKIHESPAIPDIPSVFDKTMLKSSLAVFDPMYIEKVFQKDVASMVLSVQHAGIAVTGYEVEEVENIVGAYRDYTIKFNPIDGAASTLRFKLPLIDEEGVYRANGVNYRLRKQDSDLPIRKDRPDRVALTSYYGKTFVSRSDKRVNDYATWMNNAIMAKGLDDSDTTVSNLQPAPVFDNEFPSPRLYSSIASSFRGFTVAGFAFNFDHTQREKLYGKDALDLYEKDGAIVAGINKAGQYAIVGKDDIIYQGENGVLTDLGSMDVLLHLDMLKAPVDFTVIKVMGRTVPVGVVLGYELGLERLMQLLKVKPRRVNAGARVNLLPNEYSLAFSDETLVFSREDKVAAMILAGFNEYHKNIRLYSVYEFDRRAVYLNIMEGAGSSIRFLREIDLMYQMFIDPITKELLIEMGEPTTFRGLMLRSCEMLMLDQHPDENDDAFKRKRGYERMAGAVYSNLVNSIRSHNGRAGKSKVPVELHPYAVWQTIAQDPAIALVSEINPIQNLKEIESVTHGGVGGRNSRSMTKGTRAYHRSGMGTISEATVDSSDVGINTYTSADPQFTSVRGLSRRYKVGETGATALLSTSALLSVGSDVDD